MSGADGSGGLATAVAGREEEYRWGLRTLDILLAASFQPCKLAGKPSNTPRAKLSGDLREETDTILSTHNANVSVHAFHSQHARSTCGCKRKRHGSAVAGCSLIETVCPLASREQEECAHKCASSCHSDSMEGQTRDR